jgi:hypothetical protein
MRVRFVLWSMNLEGGVGAKESAGFDLVSARAAALS